uniref:DNA helicase n=1 Tax=Grammatophora oceanica TaxID=210454 RepID=A0A7S1Y4D7_9STRA
MRVKINWTADLGQGFSFPATLSAALTQFPLLTNNATTCHKLQGASKTSLFIVGVSNAMNWMYVALSRVRTLSGLFLSTPITFRQPRQQSSLLAMIKRFLRLRPEEYSG